jgi:hypothetical protein
MPDFAPIPPNGIDLPGNFMPPKGFVFPPKTRSDLGAAPLLPADPYAGNARCKHASRIGDISISMPNGIQVSDFRFLSIHPAMAAFNASQPMYFVGDVEQRVTWQAVVDGIHIAILEIVSFHMSAEHPELGKLNISYDLTRKPDWGMLWSVAPGLRFPAIHTTVLNVTATCEKFPELILQNQSPSLVFQSEEILQWPPEKNIYKLQVPVVFENRNDPGVPLFLASDGGVYVGNKS